MSERYGPCRRCGGQGTRLDEECLACGGTGHSGYVMDLIEKELKEDEERNRIYAPCQMNQVGNQKRLEN